MFTAGWIVFSAVYTFLTVSSLETSPIAFNNGDVWTSSIAHMEGTFMAIGSSLMIILVLVSYIKQTVDFRRDFTLEIFMHEAIKVILTATVIVNLKFIITTFIDIAQDLLGIIGPPVDLLSLENLLDEATERALQDAVVSFLNPVGLLVGTIYLIVAIACSMIILVTIFMRYFEIYVLTAVAPISVAFSVSGGSLSNTSWSFLKTIIGKIFLVVFYGLILKLFTPLFFTLGRNLFDMGGFLNFVSGTGPRIGEMLSMIIMAASIKGADTLMRRAFNL